MESHVQIALKLSPYKKSKILMKLGSKKSTEEMEKCLQIII